jgi:outer membrane protein, heavy metal efflux system
MFLLAALLLVQRPAPDSLTLDEALARARAHRGQIVVAAARVAEARAAYRVAGAVPNPTVSYSHSEALPRQHLLVDQPLDWLLRRGREREAASHGIGSAQADSSQTTTDLEREVRVAFYTARAGAVAETLTVAQAALADSVATIGAARLRAGEISLLEAEQGRAEATRARQTLSSIREAARVAASDLARSVGADPTAPPIPIGALDVRLDGPQAGAIVIDRVPAVRLAVADSSAAVALARSASVGRIPLPMIQTGAEWDDPTEPHRPLAVIGLALPLPLWHQGAGTVAEARARAVAAAARVGEARLEAARRVESTRIHLEESGLRARFSRDTLLPAARALGGRALRAYQAGETGVLPVLDALRSERDAALSSVQDLLAYQTALADWESLLGPSQ